VQVAQFRAARSAPAAGWAAAREGAVGRAARSAAAMVEVIPSRPTLPARMAEVISFRPTLPAPMPRMIPSRPTGARRWGWATRVVAAIWVGPRMARLDCLCSCSAPLCCCGADVPCADFGTGSPHAGPAGKTSSRAARSRDSGRKQERPCLCERGGLILHLGAGSGGHANLAFKPDTKSDEILHGKSSAVDPHAAFANRTR